VEPDVTGSEEDDDVALALAARRGDRAAFGRLCARHVRFVRGILLARAPRRDLDDLAQEVFLRALRSVGTLRDATSFGPWLAAIARNAATDRVRAVPTSELPEDVADASGGDGEGAAILAAIRELPETYREALILRLVQGMTGPEIAERMGMTHGSVRVHLHRGIKLLRAALEGLGVHG
jgi:RNA polymerase sigma-70 factor (ECF subfamily)